MQKENREILGKILGTVVVISAGAVFGFLAYKNWERLEINILMCILGGWFVFAGAVMFMVFPKTYFPVFFLLLGLGEQVVMLLMYLGVQWKYDGIMIAGLVLLISICFAGIRQLDLHLSDEELARLEPGPYRFKPYEYADSRYTVQEQRERTDDVCKNDDCKVVDIMSAKKPPMAG